VHLVGWGLGGLFSLLTSADRQDLPIGSLTLMGTPVDLSEVPLVAPWHSLVGEPDAGVLLGRLSHLVGGVPEALVGRAAALPGVDRIVTRPLALATRLDDTDFLAQVEAMDRLTQHMSAYPGRTYGQLYHRFLAGNQLATGVVRMADRREIRLSEVRVPVLVLAGEADTIAPVAAVRPLTDLLTGARSTRLEVVPGGHLGLLTGRSARSSTWPSVDAFLDGPAAQTAARRRRTPAKRTARSRKPAPSADRIGANPARRYGSATSRSLAART
jgi:polyhydroxyalkanoate synthase